MQNSNELNTLARYRAAVRRVQMVGFAIFAVGVALRLSLGARREWVGLLVGGIGVCLIMAGVSCLRPHNVIKTFAAICAKDPSHENALCLLTALTAKKKVRMTATAIISIEQAIDAYAKREAADESIAKQLAEAQRTHVVRKMFI